MRLLITGISFLSIFFFIGCNNIDNIDDNISNDIYIYKNNSTKNLVIKVFFNNILTEEIPINIGGSKIILSSNEGGTVPFYTNGFPNGDSIVIEFEGNKCLNYLRELPLNNFPSPTEGEGLFNIVNYDNYALPLQKNHTLTYTIDNDNYNLAIDCL